ncbi:MAG: hypothetical protein NVS2B11_08950 [Acetobacteraceae bacterium]
MVACVDRGSEHDDSFAWLKLEIGAGGVERVVEISLDADEQAAFDKSCASVQELIDASRKLVG